MTIPSKMVLRISHSQKPDEDADPTGEAGEDRPADTVEASPEEGQDEPEAESKEEVQTFKYRNKEYSLEDLRKDPDLFTKVITGANQQSHYQELYEKQRQEAEELQRQIQERVALEQERQMRLEAEAQARQQQAAQQGQPQITPDIVKGHYGRQIDQMVEEGWLDGDVKEFYPNTTAGLLYLRDSLLTEIANLKQQVSGLINYASEQQYQQQTTAHESSLQQARRQVNQIFDGIASEGGIFEPLQDKQIRGEFITELQRTVNPPLQAIVEDPSILRNLWLAKNHETLLQIATEKKKSSTVSAEDARRLVTGEGSANTKASKPKSKAPIPGTEAGWADMLD
jgi:hypothetical protein